MRCTLEETRKAREVIDAAFHLSATRRPSFQARMRRIIEDGLTPAQLSHVDQIKVRPGRPRNRRFVRR